MVDCGRERAMEEESGLGFIRDVIMERSIIVCSTPRVLLRLRVGRTRDPDATRKVAASTPSHLWNTVLALTQPMRTDDSSLLGTSHFQIQGVE
jgi:hypothetical protein